MFRAWHTLAVVKVVCESGVTGCAIQDIIRSRSIKINGLEAAVVAVGRAGVASSSIMVSCVSRVTVGAVYHWNF